MQPMTISQIIRAAGGARAIVAAMAKDGTIMTRWAVYRWSRHGIPDTHWRVIMQLAPGVDESMIYRANEALRRAPLADNDDRRVAASA